VGNSYVVSQERCPKCSEMGKDQSGDNLAVYSDSHRYCFGCGYYRSGNVSYVSRDAAALEKRHKVSLPEDCNTDYTQQELNWVAQYDLCRSSLLKYNVLHSDKGIRINRKGELVEIEHVLIFPVFDDGLLGYQARTFIEDVPKWIGRGKWVDIYNILPGSKTLVLTEDIVSAIKVNMAGHASMPVYGSTIKNRFERLYKLGYRDVIIWLDPDMHTKVIREVKYAKGLSTRIVFSNKDPKCYTLNEIRGFLK